MNKRDARFDYIRGVAMLMIVWGHFGVRPDWVHDMMNPIWLACFFVCSGYFHRDRPLNEQLSRKAQLLLLPWLIYTAVGYVSQLLMAMASHHLSDFRWNMIAEDLWSGELFEANIPVWFLLALFAASMAHGALRKLTRNTVILLTFGFVASMSGHYLLAHGYPLPMQMAKALIYLPFLQLGTLIAEKRMNVSLRWGGLFLALSIVSVWGRYMMEWRSCVEASLMLTYWVDFALSLSVFVALYGLMPQTAHRDLIHFCGRNSLFLLGSHIIVMGWGWLFFWSFFHRAPGVWEAPFVVLAIVLICAAGASLGNKVKLSFKHA